MTEQQQPTQVKFPLRATVRTIVSTLISALTVLNLIVPAIISAIGDKISPERLVWWNSLALLVATISGVVTRIMAIPQVNEWLKKLNLSASK